jgi:mRNA-degrading endonuclease RelE of RelBE toxin-antitoxin system
MIDNEVLKAKIAKDLKKLKLSKEQEEIIVKELNYLANLLIDIYLNKTKGGENNK